MGSILSIFDNQGSVDLRRGADFIDVETVLAKANPGNLIEFSRWWGGLQTLGRLRRRRLGRQFWPKEPVDQRRPEGVAGHRGKRQQMPDQQPDLGGRPGEGVCLQP